MGVHAHGGIGQHGQKVEVEGSACALDVDGMDVSDIEYNISDIDVDISDMG